MGVALVARGAEADMDEGLLRRFATFGRSSTKTVVVYGAVGLLVAAAGAACDSLGWWHLVELSVFLLGT